MRLLLLISCIFLAFGLGASNTPDKPPYRWKKAGFGAALAFVSGASNGMHEVSVHHPHKLPNSWNKQFWDARISWVNKYDQGNPDLGPAYFGSTTFLAWTTDSKHLFGTLHRFFGYGAVFTITLGEKKPWYHYVFDFLICGAAYSAGFHTVYSLAF